MLSQLMAALAADANLTNAIATLAGVVVSVLALFVSGVSLYVASATLRHQREHNILSVRPLAFIVVNDYENRLTVSLRNHGIGPLVVKSLVAARGSGTKSTLIDWMPELPNGLFWTSFAPDVSGRSISPDSEIPLLELEGDMSKQSFTKVRDECRRRLATLLIRVEYTDMYNSDLPPYERSLDWFGRHE